MSHLTTRSKNASQHPGQVMMEGKQKRCTSEQIQLDNARAEEARQEEVASQERRIKRLANIIEQTTAQETNILTNPPRPRPRRVILKVSDNRDPESQARPLTEDNLDKQSASQFDGSEEVSCLPDDSTDEEATTSDGQQKKAHGELEEVGTMQRRPRAQKVSTRDAVEAVLGGNGPSHQEVGVSKEQNQAEKGKCSGTSYVFSPTSMILLTETVLFYWDLYETSCRLESSKTSRGKNDFAGIKDWSDKLVSSKSLHAIVSGSQHTTANSSPRGVSSISSGVSRVIKAPPASLQSTSTRTGTNNGLKVRATSEVQDDPYLDGDDLDERRAMENPSQMMVVGRRTAVMGIGDVVSGSEGDEWVPPPSPSFAVGKSYTRRRVNSYPKSNVAGRKQMKRPRLPSEGEEQESEVSGAPPSKRSKPASHRRAGSSHRLGSGANNRYIKDDLPIGSTVDNAWRRLFISALSHFVGGFDNPWTVPTDKFLCILQETWDTVYANKIEHTITTHDAVFHLAKQGLNNWRGGFAAAATVIVSTLFDEDAEFEDPDQRIEFAKALLDKKRYLFSQSKGSDSKTWTGLWRSALVLQTLAHHFNFIQGRAVVNTLETELHGPRGALALACTAVLRILTLVADNKVSYIPSGRPGSSGACTVPVIPKGSQYEFNESIWGASTKLFLKHINELSAENFEIVITETMKYVKKGATSTTSTVDSPAESDDDELFQFR